MTSDSMEQIRSSVHWRRTSIGSKFTVLITGLLAITLVSFLYNAAHLFKKDNLDSVYLFTDILNASKAGEVSEWLTGILSRLNLIGSHLEDVRYTETGTLNHLKSTQDEMNKDVTILNRFIFSKQRGSYVFNSQMEPWENLRARHLKAENSIHLRDLLKKAVVDAVEGTSPSKFKQANWLSIQSNKTLGTSVQESSSFFMIFPAYESAMARVINRDTRITDYQTDKLEVIGALLDATSLTKIFSGTGPYAVLLLDNNGKFLGGTDSKEDLIAENFLALPFVRNMLTSKLDREFQEFVYRDQVFLGAYQRLASGSLNVVSWVPKTIALETGEVLVRRTIMIGVLLFLGAFMLTYVFVEKLVNPILQLRNATKLVSQGNFGTKVSVSSHDEIFDLATSFNSMSDEIERRIQNLYRINDASGKIRGTRNIQELMDFATNFLSTLLEGQYAFGMYFGYKQNTGKLNAVYSKKSWPEDLSYKEVVLKFSKSKEIAQHDFSSIWYLICPISYQDRTKGMIVVGGRPENRDFKSEDIFMARTVMAMVSADVENIQYQNELRDLNADLENRVVERTQELAEANLNLQETTLLTLRQKKELDDVMNNIQQAIVTLDSSGKINPDYSKFAVELFGCEDISGQSIIDLLFTPAEKELHEKNLLSWIESVFASPESFEMIQDFALKDHEYSRIKRDGNSGDAGKIDKRQIHFEWRPIYEPRIEDNENKIIKLMLVCFDLTEQKRLEREIKRQEETHKEELEIIAQLIKNPVGVVEQFISDFSRNLKEGTLLLSEKESAESPNAGRSLLGILHTLKGSIKQFGLKSIQQKAHDLEQKVSLFYKKPGKGTANLERFSAIRAEFKSIEDSLQRMIQVYQKIMVSKSGHQAGSSPVNKGIAIPQDKLERLLGEVFRGPGTIDKAIAKKSVAGLLLTPVKGLFDRLDAMAKSLAEELEYEVNVVRMGESTQLDLRILPYLYDALLHVVRNSLDHAGEAPDIRRKKGKNSAIQVQLSASIVDGTVKITLADDGKGIDRNAVLKKALSSGLIQRESVKDLSDSQILNLIFMPGFSTKEEVSDISGRGVGMDVVKSIVEEKLRGKLEIRSKLGQGTRLEITLSSQFMVNRPLQKSEIKIAS